MRDFDHCFFENFIQYRRLRMIGSTVPIPASAVDFDVSLIVSGP
jgi:hypothetical protein